MNFTKENIRVIYEKLLELSESKLCDLSFEYLKCDGYKTSNEFPADSEPWIKSETSIRLSGVDEHYWIKLDIDPVSLPKHKELIFSLKTGKEGQWDAVNPQGLVFLNGKTLRALDVNHTYFKLDGDTKYSMYIYMYTGMDPAQFDIIPSLTLRDTPTYSLYWDIKVPADTLNLLEENSYDAVKIEDVLNKAVRKIDLRDFYSDDYYKSLDETAGYLKEELYTKLAGGNGASVNFLGHTHIDVAWLWTVAQTKEKAERSFATVISLLNEYPDYIFMSSQPQLYQYVKEANPELYAEIKKAVCEGRWEVDGAMWLEADCNLISGESMVRQILFGKKFMKEEFGVDSKTLWLPDVFGYSAALPQILKKSGVDKFHTTKLTWNETNKIPHDTFMWQGIDGTEIFTHLCEAYVNLNIVEDTRRYWEQYKNKSLTNEIFMPVGYADGGGGTSPEMIEIQQRLKNGLPGMPKVEFKTAGETLDKIEKDFNENTKEMGYTPKWIGELYLEMHRGTYTSIAKNKKYNRKCELLYQEAEALSVTDMILTGGEYDKETLDKNQYNILLNQFHDIIPGSSIKEVYDVTDAEYPQIMAAGRAIADGCKQKLMQNISTDGGIFVYNPTPYEISDYVEADGKLYFAENVPAHGYKVIKSAPVPNKIKVGEKTIENNLVKVTFNDAYEIASIYDKEAGREVVASGSAANRLNVYEDYPRCYDAWEITDYYKNKKWTCNDVSEVRPTENGIYVKRNYGHSVIEQEIVLRPDSKRIDFVTKIDWHEDHVLLRCDFPVNVHTTKATYDIQFGNIERPTTRNNSWEQAQFEVCAHKWGDISEGDYGVSLLNDCKYGYSAEENVISLSLLKAATYPNPEADRGMHEFTYSLLPHTGDFREGETVKEAYLLNMPLEAEKIGASNGKLPEEYSLVSCKNANISLETIKKCENDDSIIVRLFDCHNVKSKAEINVGFDFKKAYLCNLLEESVEEIEADGNALYVPVGNYEIITLKIVR